MASAQRLCPGLSCARRGIEHDEPNPHLHSLVSNGVWDRQEQFHPFDPLDSEVSTAENSMADVATKLAELVAT